MGDTECTARGRPRLSLRLLLILTTDTDILVWDTPDTVTDTVSDTPDTVTDTTVTDTVTDTTDGDVKATADKLHQDLSVNQQLNAGKNGFYQFEFEPSPVLPFQCCHTRSLVMASRKQENQSVIIRQIKNNKLKKKS